MKFEIEAANVLLRSIFLPHRFITGGVYPLARPRT
jgi:hypothetical protein